MAEKQVETRSGAGDTAEKHGPPIPKWMYRFVNPALKALLRSPLHRPISNALLVLSFQGRKSGKRFSIPVGYVRHGDRLWLLTHSNWWKNLRDVPVSVLLQGKDVRGTASPVRERAAKAEVARAFVERRGEAMARRMGIVTPDGNPVEQEAPEGTTFIEIKLENAGA